jgi:ATP-dependent Lon protease
MKSAALRQAVHVHFPEAATPKDGPSAGLTFWVAMLSAMTGLTPAGPAAFTGEITLLGEVLAVGGVREKLLAALRAGLRRVYLPELLQELERVEDGVRGGQAGGHARASASRSQPITVAAVIGTAGSRLSFEW